MSASTQPPSQGSDVIVVPPGERMWRRLLTAAADNLEPLMNVYRPYVDGLDNLPADGRFLIISESLAPDWTSPALLFPGDPTQGGAPVELRFRPAKGFRITDAAQLPDGRLLLLQRDVSLLGGMSAKLVLVDVAALDSRRPVEGREIAHFERPLSVDNMEALSITREGEQTIVWLASDDNYFPLQRTLLMKFALRE